MDNGKHLEQQKDQLEEICILMHERSEYEEYLIREAAISGAEWNELMGSNKDSVEVAKS